MSENGFSAEAVRPEGGELLAASQGKLAWLKFRRHRLALASGFLLAAIYLVSIFCEFFSPYAPDRYDPDLPYAPPQRVGLDVRRFGIRPVAFGYKSELDPKTYRTIYSPDPSKVYPIFFFVRGEEYKMWGLWKTGLRLVGVKTGSLHLLGTDPMGRDVLSRALYGARISTSIGLVCVLLMFVLGIVLGGISGYFGGVIDSIIQRTIDFMLSIPQIPLWMALTAALPPHWSPVRVYFGITIIISLVGWPKLAREVRSKFLSLREEDFVLAARLIGARRRRIIFRHMVPSFLSHIIASITLTIPAMILAETSLSFLGIGLKEPAISWGVLLQDAQNIRAVATAPWLLLPGLFVVVTALSFNFLGDGLRDAADPYVR